MQRRRSEDSVCVLDGFYEIVLKLIGFRNGLIVRMKRIQY